VHSFTHDMLPVCVAGVCIPVTCTLQTTTESHAREGEWQISYRWYPVDQIASLGSPDRRLDAADVARSQNALRATVEVEVMPPSQPGEYTLEFAATDTSGSPAIHLESIVIQVLPPKVPWEDLAQLPLAAMSCLNRRANEIEFIGDTYDSAYSLDYRKDGILPLWLGSYLKSDLGLTGNARILEVGTGTGKYRLALLKCGYKHVYGCDTSEAMLEKQRWWQDQLGLSGDSGELLRGDLASVMITDFDLIIMASTLHHMSDLRAFLSSASQHLGRTGKLLALDEPCNKKWFHQFREGEERVPLSLDEFYSSYSQKESQRTYTSLRLAEYWDGAGFKESDLRTALRECGFASADFHYYGLLSIMWLHHLRQLADPSATQIGEALSQIDEQLRRVIPRDRHKDIFLDMMFVAHKSA
jgi:SAM-dependent methyltransferase